MIIFVTDIVLNRDVNILNCFLAGSDKQLRGKEFKE